MDEQKGRWLIAENMTLGPMSFRHPDPKASDIEHLDLEPLGWAIIDELWLGVPWFVRAVENGMIRVYRSDRQPDYDHGLTSVVDRLMGRGLSRHAAITAYYLCASEPIPPEIDQYIDLSPAPRNQQELGSKTALTPRYDLVRDHLNWLRVVLELEKSWRQRPDVVGRLEKRIAELEAMRV